MLGLAVHSVPVGAFAQDPAVPAAPAAAPAEPTEPVAPAAPPAPAPASGTIGSDLVRLRDGSQFRGTLVEQVPGSHVVLVTFSGEAKRFVASELEYAGPVPVQPAAAVAPAAPPGAPVLLPKAPGTVRLSLRPPAPFSIYLGTGAKLKRHCYGECTVDVLPGPYRFAVGSNARPAVIAPGVFDIQADDEVVGEFESHRGTRIAGGVIMGVGLVSGLTLLGRGLHMKSEAEDFCEDDYDCSVGSAGRPQMAIGGIIAALGAVVGGVLFAKKDRAFVHPRKARLAATGNAAL
jgi:hypothetical protein